MTVQKYRSAGTLWLDGDCELAQNSGSPQGNNLNR
jgi:hypothetical protein